ncbi:Cof-type HAD-IIB family hydrolase [Pseudothermotoga sp. U03pept]|uniref:Cof-type HAD-IIB family hydrolase n=1 Tax=Pseudothermotoga sp. U03pept TaxID=3447012 RepID=UPI003F04FE92
MKIFVFDLDGTILQDTHNIHPANVEAIEKLMRIGKEIVFASGRMLPSIVKLLRRYFQKDFPLIAYNGSVVWLPEAGKVLDVKIDPATARAVVEFLRKAEMHRQAYIDDKLVVEEENEFAKAYSDHSQIELTVVSDLAREVGEKGATKLLAIDDPVKLDSIIGELRATFKGLSIFKSFANYLDFVPSQVDKGEALKLIARCNNWDLKDAVAFGDNDNDIPLLKAVGFKVAVANGTQALKEVADVIVEENTKGGPGIFILDMLQRGLIG